MGVITETPRSATAIAADESRLLLIEKFDFDVLLGKNPRLGYVIMRNVVKNLSERLRQANALLAEKQAAKGRIR